MSKLFIGREKEEQSDVYLDSSKSRAILICGKRGSGKSYSMGVLIEELHQSTNVIQLVVDPMGIFHTMSLPNNEQEQLVWDWGDVPKELPVRVLVPGDPVQRYGGLDIVEALEERGIEFIRLALNPCDVTTESWCDSFKTSINEPMGIALHKAVLHCQKKIGSPYFINDIIEAAKKNSRTHEKTLDALLNRLEMALHWGIFAEDRYYEFSELLAPEKINVLDLSVLDSGRYGRRGLVLSVLTRDLFRKRSIQRRREELGLAPEKQKFWLLIDEAHQFVPSGKSALSKEELVRWVKEGRQPGLSLVIATQQPSAIDAEVLSQCDAIISHSLSIKEDKAALNRLTKDYMSGDIKNYINQVNKIGEAVFVDDFNESISLIQVRPRLTRPGGSEA